jgi:Glycosyl transferases group 1
MLRLRWSATIRRLSADEMRLAFITSLLPTGKPDTGFEIANACVLDALREAGCTVMLFGFLRSDETTEPPPGSVVLDRMVIENAVATRGQKLRWLAESFRHNLPVISTKLAAFGEARLRKIIDSHGPFDAYVINSAPVAGAFPSLLEKPSILVAHNVEHASARENAASAGGLTGRLYRREARLLEQVEHRALAAAKFIWCFSQEDREGFGIDIDVKSAVLPLLTPLAAKLPGAEPAYDIGLIGTWTWQPNIVGLRWFLDEVVPNLSTDMSIAVAGRLPAGFHTSHRHVTLLGRVPDATAFVASARAIALTSRNGTGIQLKTIETFQLGKPAVATRSSIRGLSQLPTNCLVADDAKGFAAALTKLVWDVRAERTQIADGSIFVAQQKKGMREAVKQALLAIKR